MQAPESKPASSILSTATASVLELKWPFKLQWISALLGLLVFLVLLWNWNLSDRAEALQKQVHSNQQVLENQAKELELKASQQGESLARLEINLVAHLAAGPNETLQWDALAQVDAAIQAVRQWQKSHRQTALISTNAALATAPKAIPVVAPAKAGASGYWSDVLQWLSEGWKNTRTAALEAIGSWVRIRPLPSLEVAQLGANNMTLAEDTVLLSLLSARLALLARQNNDAIRSVLLAQQQSNALFTDLSSPTAQTAHESLTLALQKALRALQGV